MAEEFEGQRVTVMGLGRFGGGVGVARFLAARGADVLVTDRGSADGLAKSVARLQPLIDTGQVTLRLGGHHVSDFTTCDLVVANPAVPPDSRFVRAAQAAGIPVTTEVRLLVERLPNRLRTIGVTGSAGKSTVTAMIGHILGKAISALGRQAAGARRVWVGGNIGGSLLESLDEIDATDWVVLELSSFMLERLRGEPDTLGGAEGRFRGWSPHVAVVTNLSENHLDWHGSMAAYQDAKSVILRHQQRGDIAILHDSLTDWPVAPGVVCHRVGCEGLEPAPRLQVVGVHNRENAVLAAAVGEALALGDRQQSLRSLADFPGLPHRLQFVGAYDGVKYYNDSKCTTPVAARRAVEALCAASASSSDSRAFVHVIVGGHDKGSDLSPLAGFVRGTCRAVYTVGETGEAVALAAEAADPGGGGGPGVDPGAGAEVVRCVTLRRAVDAARGRVVPGDVVLLSPGCASWDQFENYEQRGERFVELVRAGRGG